MSTTDYLLNGVLIALVVLQVRGRRLTVRTLLVPLAIVTYVAFEYLHGIPTAGNDLSLVLLGGLAGVLLGTGCGLATAVFRRPDGATVSKAGPVAAALWVLGIGARVAFALYSTHGGGGAVERFSAAHGITSSEAWVTCLILMAVCEVVARTATIGLKFRSASGHDHGGADRRHAGSLESSSIMEARVDA